jgi:transposase
MAVADAPERGGLEKELAARDRIAALEAQLAARDQRIAELEAALNALTEKLNQNSRNSHKPPSSDGPGAAGRGERPQRKKSTGRKRGGQKGHRGARRMLLPTERVDRFIELFAEACNACATALPRTPDSDPRRYQLVDWSDNKIVVTEFRRHEVSCPSCGRRTRAAYDPKVIPASPFGPGFVGLAAVLTGVYHLSRRRAQQLLHELLGIELSLGALSGLEARASVALVPAVKEAEQQVEHADVKHTDATSWLLAGVLRSLWVVATTMATVYKIFSDGRRETIRALFGTMRGILVSDRATVFTFWMMAMRQICWAHLLRKFVSFSQRAGPAEAFGKELLQYTALVFDYWHGFKNGQLTRDELATWMRPVQQQFKQCLQRAAHSGLELVSGSCADILAHENALWTFVTHEGVEPTNNHAEHELRPNVIWRKCSFGSQSERGERFVERVMTVAQTARKQRKNVLDFIVESVKAHVQGHAAPSLFATP